MVKTTKTKKRLAREVTRLMLPDYIQPDAGRFKLVEKEMAKHSRQFLADLAFDLKTPVVNDGGRG